MGKSAKKKAVDLRGYATTSVTSAKKEEAEKQAAATADASVVPAATAVAAQAAIADPDGSAAPLCAEANDEDEWEAAVERLDAAADSDPKTCSVVEAPSDRTGGVAGGDVDLDDEEWSKMVERRLDEELSRYLDKRFVPADALTQFERRSTFAPAGVVVLNGEAEKRIDAALARLRDTDGVLRPTFPKHWRYKGKLTYERINSIYLALESLLFRAEHIRLAMEQTYGMDVRAALEYLFVTLPQKELPRQFGGEGVGDVADSGPHKDRGDDDADKVEADVDQMEPGGAVGDLSEELGNEEATVDENAPDVGRNDVGDHVCENKVACVLRNGDDDQPAADKREAATQLDTSTSDAPKVVQVKHAAKAVDEKEEQKQFNKQWAAQYYAGGDSDGDELIDENERLERERKKDPTARYIKIVHQFEELEKLCKALKNKKKCGSFKQNISADMAKQKEASLKIGRLRAEMEVLESGKYGRLEQDRIEKRRPAIETKQAPKSEELSAETKTLEDGSCVVADGKTCEEEQQTCEEDDELPSLFDGNLESSPADSNDGLPKCRRYESALWKGKLPKDSLREYCLKQIWSKKPPDNVTRYEKLPESRPGRFYAKVSIPQPRNQPTHVFCTTEPCDSLLDAENLAAMLALYKLADPAFRAELTRSVPPAYKIRLGEWEEEEAARLREERREKVRSRVNFVLELLRNKPQMSLAHQGPDACSSTVASASQSLVVDDEIEFKVLGGDAAARLRKDFVLRRESLEDVCSYQEIQTARANLPVAEYRDMVVNSIKRSPVVIVGGATGSGKTTQVPQFILEDALKQHSQEPMPNIIVTEPRRISAVSVAQRVSQELGDPQAGPGARGSLVGYQIRLEKKVSESTRLLFCTVGVLLKRLQQGLGALSKVTHVFLDEVHERSADCDLLILLLKQIRFMLPELRIVLMSATLEVKKIVSYFGSSVPVVDIPGRTFPVQEYWLEDIIEMTGYDCGEESEFAKRDWAWNKSQKLSFQVSGAKGNKETLTTYVDDDNDEIDDEAEGCEAGYHKDTCRALARMDHSRINFAVIVLLLEYIEQCEHFNEVSRTDGAVLIFLPGLGEISKMHEWITRSPILNDPQRFLILSLHSILSGEDHARAFLRPPRGVRKIVLSTNIAETGVTIPDVVFVIDAGKVKQQQYHEPSNTSALKEKFVSRAEVLQRRGRAGRVREGFSFHLLTKRRYELRLQEMPTPEILRCSLMELTLSMLTSGLQPTCFLEALDPPPRSRIEQALTTLRAVGAVEEGVRPVNALQIGQYADDTWYVATPLGLCLSRLPCDVRLGKMVLLSALFGGVDAVLTIAATLSYRSPLATPFSEAKRAAAKAVHWAELMPKDQPPSDHVALNVAYTKWEEATKNGKSGEAFCRKSWLNGQVLQTVRDIKRDLMDSARSEGFAEKFEKNEVSPQELRSPQTTAALLFAGLFPNVARVDAPQSATDKSPGLWAGNEQLKLHPGSLCGGPRLDGLHRTNYRWICYHTKLKTSQVFLRDSTFLAPNALLLFGGEPASLNVHPVEKTVSIGVGAERHWHTFYVAPRTAALVRQLRYAFDSVLRRKASDARRPLSQEDRLVLSAYLAVMNSVDAP